MKRYFTIGIAGHIDHGKTTLTKALTGIDTDRLKEERERSISIEPGYAPLIRDEQLEVSIIDVPGHKRFIRQMIAGVAGINLVIIVIAADEGMMPQTKEHLNILSLLGIQNGIIVITKTDGADHELLEIILEDIKENLKCTFLEDAPIYFVDSVSKKGISELKTILRERIFHMNEVKGKPFFRLPIDQVFTVKGQGVIVRGTVYDGEVKQGERLKILPSGEEVRVRQIQSHYNQKEIVSVGQRVAINIGGIAYENVSRGDVLVADDYFFVSSRIDVVFYSLEDIKLKIKQRQRIKLHIGTSEVMGKIIFFDRNEINVNDKQEILCQFQLDEQIVVSRGDRFIVRRPTPFETIGGGWIIEPNANKHRFGTKTINQLELKKVGSTKERVLSLLEEKATLTYSDILMQVSITAHEFNEVKPSLVEIHNNFFTSYAILDEIKDKIINIVDSFHQQFPMRIGMNKAEIISELGKYPTPLIQFAIDELKRKKHIVTFNQYVSLDNVNPILPPKWKNNLENVERQLISQGIEVEDWEVLLIKNRIPSNVQREFYNYLIQMEKAYNFGENKLISKKAIFEALGILRERTKSKDFDIQNARDIFQLTRKKLVLLLELFDDLGYTKRSGNKRMWIRDR